MSDGRYRAYPKYKDSGVEWVGPIPDSWSVKPLLAAAENVCVKNEDGAESNVLSLSYGSIIRRDIEDNSGLLPESFDTYQLVSADDIILRLTDLQNDKRSLRVGLAKEKGIITSAYLKLTAKPSQLDSGYLYRLLHSYDTTKVFYGMGGGLRQSMKFDDMRRLDLLLPPLPEQTQIAKFLDHETAKIDRLIEKQEELIRLLKEKRQAVISRAVTKGLNPHAPLKDSGIEWLGQVPSHWKLMKGSWIGRLFGSEPVLESAVTDEGDTPYIKVSTLSAEGFDLGDCEFFLRNTVSKKYGTSSGYVVFPKRGAAIFTNKVNIVSFDSVIDPNLMGWKIGPKALPQFIAHLLKLRGLGDIADVSTVPQINNKHIDPIIFPIPEIDEQASIIAFLAAETENFDQLIVRAQEAISLIQERRTALISAAVTGKIDVRHWQPPADNAA